MKGLAKRLRTGVPRLHPNGIVQILDENSQVRDLLKLERPSDIGMVYERLVGLHYESRGYEVDYRGLLLGFLDGGMDLVATKKGLPTLYVQCKTGRLSMQSIEKLLYAADCYFRRVKPTKGSGFVLAIPSLASTFTCKKAISATGRKITSYPVASYFLSKNDLGLGIRLSIAELALPIAGSSESISWSGVD